MPTEPTEAGPDVPASFACIYCAQCANPLKMRTYNCWLAEGVVETSLRYTSSMPNSSRAFVRSKLLS